jgi:hypothetical protein
VSIVWEYYLMHTPQIVFLPAALSPHCYCALSNCLAPLLLLLLLLLPSHCTLLSRRCAIDRLSNCPTVSRVSFALRYLVSSSRFSLSSSLCCRLWNTVIRFLFRSHCLVVVLRCRRSNCRTAPLSIEEVVYGVC